MTRRFKDPEVVARRDARLLRKQLREKDDEYIDSFDSPEDEPEWDDDDEG